MSSRQTTEEIRSAAALDVIGYVLAVSYPLLAFSAAGRSVYQLFFKAGIAFETGPLLSAFAGLCYLLAAFGFAFRRPWTWILSLTVLVIESFGTVLVGTLSIVAPDLVGRSVWRLYGVDFAFFPLVQPFLGIVWLLWPHTRSLFGVPPARPGL